MVDEEEQDEDVKLKARKNISNSEGDSSEIERLSQNDDSPVHGFIKPKVKKHKRKKSRINEQADFADSDYHSADQEVIKPKLKKQRTTEQLKSMIAKINIKKRESMLQ